MRTTSLALATVLATAFAGAAAAQSPVCASREATTPATPPAPGASGTAPGNAGNTGWTGGTGQSLIGTSIQGAAPESRSWQPPTATGLDLAGVIDPNC